MGEKALDIDLEDSTLTVKVENKDAGELLNEELTLPFSLNFMLETQEETETNVEGFGNFKPTGVTDEHISWLEPQEEPAFPGKGRILVGLTEEGREIMKEVFMKNKGKLMGLFVRGQLAALLSIEKEELEDIIVISQLPTVELAHVFADDVNVGIYVTFEPVD